MKKKLRKYYFKRKGAHTVTVCQIKNDGTRIGSINCRSCINCEGFLKPMEYNEGEKFYIICSQIDKATGKTK